MNNNKGWLYLKRAFVLLMGTLLVWQTFGTDVTYAFAQGSVEAVQALTQPVDDADGQADEGASVDGSSASDGAAAGEQTGSTEGESAGADESADGAGSSGVEDDDSSDAAAQSGENGIALASDGDLTGTYNPDADAVDVSDDCEAAVTLYKDSGHTTPLGDTAITTSEKFYARLQIDFKKLGPTLATPNVMYRFPSNVSVKDMGETPLIDSSTGDFAGTWYIQDNIAYFKYNEAYLNKTVTHAFANLDCGLSDANKGDGSSETIKFNGSSTSTTVYIKDGDVNASKFGEKMNETWNGPTYNQADNSYTWTIKISPATYATNVKLEDTIGSNLTFDQGSFKLVNASGEEVSGRCDVTVSGQVATVGLGDLAAGDYYVQYKTYVKTPPTTDGTSIPNVDNKVKYSWGSDDNRKDKETSKAPQEAKYSMVSKSADGSSTPSAIKWVVKLNGGSIKADMGGYAFSDTLGSDQTFTDASVEIKDASGNLVEVDVSKSDSSLSFTLPDDAGKQEYTVTYYTKMTNVSSLDAVKNTAEVTTPDPSQGPSGEGTGTYNPPDRGTYITKTLTSTIDSANYDGKASWKSEILFSDMASSTDPTKIVFSDQFGELPNGVKVSLDGDVTLKVGEDGATLVEGVDYTITKASGEVGAWNDLFKITFANTDAVRSLIGQAGAKVVVTYSTQTTLVSGEYPTGTYKNKSSVKTDKKSTVSAEASYTIEKAVEPPAVTKDGTSTAWNGGYEWADGATGAWITSWTVDVNKTGDADWQYKPVLDLGGKDVVVTDTLPANSEIVGKVEYSLKTGHWRTVASGEVDAMTSDGVATITVPTSAATESVYVVFTYQTATKGSVDSSDSITNSAQASSGSYTFPEGSDTVTVDNKALSKTGKAVSGTSAREYTITVNENAYDLVPGSDELTLVDDLDYRGELAGSTISVKSSQGIDLIASGQASYELAKIAEGGNTHTRLTIKVPDSMKVVVTYMVVPSGEAGDLMENFSNSCSLRGVVSSATNLVQTFNVARSSSGTGSESWGISITKYDSSGRKNLEGATFELWKIDLDSSTKTDIKKVKVDTQTSDAAGKVSFGTESSPLVSNTLYYFVETAAPSGYEISFTGNTYVMLKSDATKDLYQDAYDKAVALGFIPSSATSYSAYDELSAGSFELNLEKSVEGAEAPEGATFTFHAEATGDNAASAPALADATVTTDAAGEGTYAAKLSGTLSDSMNGQTFTYHVSESGTAPSGWTYDATTYLARVEVCEEGGRLVGKVTYSKVVDGGETVPVDGDKMSFTNTYEAKRATATATLKVSKAVTGATGATKDKEFTFALYEKGGSEALQTVKAKAGQTVAFADALSFAGAGTYEYEIRELGEPGAGWTYAAPTTATVTVKENADRSLSASVKYGRATDDGSAALFTNAYSSSGKLGLSVTKTVNGATSSSDRQFTFGLYKTDADGNKTGDPISTVTAKADGVPVTLSGPSYGQGDDGKAFTYVISETSKADKGWTNAADQKVVVKVSDNGDGTMSATPTYEGGGSSAAFDNSYEATGSATIKVSKTVNGQAPGAGESFDFELRAVTDGAPMPEAGGESATTTGAAAASFGEIAYSLADAGRTYVYQVVETSALGTGWTAAPAATVTVKVGEDKGDGTLGGCTVTYGDNAAATSAAMDNLFERGRATISVEKTVNGGEIPEGKELTFVLLDGEGEQVGDEVTATRDDPIVPFDELTFDRVGTYTYIVHETTEEAEGWTNDSDVTVTLTVGSVDGRFEVTYASYSDGSRGYGGDGSYVVRFDDRYGVPDEPGDDTPEEPGDETPGNPEGDKPRKQVPQTGDLNGALGPVAAALAAAGVGLVATGLHRSRRRK